MICHHLSTLLQCQSFVTTHIIMPTSVYLLYNLLCALISYGLYCFCSHKQKYVLPQADTVLPLLEYTEKELCDTRIIYYFIIHTY